MSALATALVCLMTTGCAATDHFTLPWKKAEAKADAPKDNVSAPGRGLIREPIDARTRAQLDDAQRLLQEKKYTEAERIYKPLSKGDGSWWNLGLFDSKDYDAGTRKRLKYSGTFEEALFHLGECQRAQKNYRDATETYTRLLTELPRTQYTQRACLGLFEIADYWLEPTRRQMNEYQEQLEGNRKFVTPAMYVHFSKDMPLMDAEGHATQILNTIRYNDINGPLGEKALFCLGTINFFRAEYKEADYYFTELFQRYPNSKWAAKSVKQSVICKQLVTGGTVYDLRTVEESKKLLMQAQASYPELVKDDKWVETQLKSINIQQADRDFKIAEFYERTGHPGSAYFYYELVCRRYPGTHYETQAKQKKQELRGKVETEQKTSGERPLQASAPFEPMLLRGMPLAPRVLPPGVER